MKNSFSTMEILRQMFTNSSRGMQLIFVFILMGVCYVLISFIAMLLAVPLFSLSLKEIQLMAEEGFQGASISLIRYFQVFQTIGIFLIPALLVNNLVYAKSELLVGYHKKGLAWSTLLIAITLVASVPFIQLLIQWNISLQLPESWKSFEEALRNMETERELLSNQMLGDGSYRSLIINTLIMAVVPSISEEFFFRGVLQALFVRWLKNAHLGIILAAVVFSAFHMQFYGFIPRVVLGLYFGYLLFWSKSIWIPVLAHFINNLLAVLFAFFEVRGSLEIPMWFQNASSWLFLCLSIGLTSLAIYLTRRITQLV